MTPKGPAPRQRPTHTPRSLDVDGVLLCAGAGERLRPLTESIPKALVPVAGRPLVDYHLNAWHAAGIARAILVTGYREDQLRLHVGDGSRYGLEVDYVTQSGPRGTGQALLAAADHLRAPWVLVGYGDVFFGRGASIWTTLLSDRRAKIVGAQVRDAGAFGRLVTDPEGPWPRLLAIHEKDRHATPGLVNSGAYLLPRKVVEILRTVPLSPRGEVELTDAVTRYVAEGGEVRVVPTEDWVDVGTPEHVEAATRLATASRRRIAAPNAPPGPER